MAEIDNAEVRFNIAYKEWEAAENKSPGEFARIFSCNEGGAFANAGQLAEAYEKIERLAQGQRQWNDAQRLQALSHLEAIREQVDARFSRRVKKWIELAGQNPQKATPAYFTGFFGMRSDGGCFTDEKEAANAFDEIVDLVEAQKHWGDAEKDRVLDTYRKMGAGAEIEDKRPSYGDELWEEDVLNWNPLDEFKPQGMGKNVCFRRGTFNIIGARPGCGKTTFAIKLLADTIEWRNDSRVIFLSYEEEPKDIYTRIYSHLIFARAKKEGRLTEIKDKNPYIQIYNAVKHRDAAKLGPDLDWARGKVRWLEKTRRLAVKDFDGGTINEIEEALRNYPRAVVIIDYLQLIDADPDFAGNELAGLKDISKRLARLAKKKRQIIITLAQLKRYGQQDAGDSDKPSQLTVDRLKDCGQFEQDAATVIELGMSTERGEEERKERDKGEPFYFWKIVKNRRQGGRNQCCLFNTADGAMGWSCMEGTEESAAFLDYSKPKAKKEGAGAAAEPQASAGNNAENKAAADWHSWRK